jgi:hypothetical protein
MGRTLSFEYEEAILRLQLLRYIISHKIIIEGTDIAKTTQQLGLEDNMTVVTSRHKKY